MNNLAAQSEKKGSAMYPQWLIDGFNDTLMDTGLKDLKLCGYKYTWEWGRNTKVWLEERLDRAMANSLWFSLSPSAKMYHMEVSLSDNNPILLEPKTKTTIVRRKFRFENAWLTESLCQQIVKDSWESCAEYSIIHKVRRCGENLEIWERGITSCFSKRIKDCKSKLKQLRSNRDSHAVQEYKEEKQKLFSILDQN